LGKSSFVLLFDLFGLVSLVIKGVEVVLKVAVVTGGNLSSGALPSTVAGLGRLKPVVESVRLCREELIPKK